MDNDARITLGLLNAVDETESLTQRTIASDLDIALGLTNTYLKRCVKKGFVKVQQVPRNRYVYFLTPRGFAEKSRLTAEYLGQSFNLFRQARQQYAAVFEACRDRGWTKIALWGSGDLAEIAVLYGFVDGVTVAAIIDPAHQSDEPKGVPVVLDVGACCPIDGVVITCLNDPQGAFEAACSAIGPDRVLAPKLLHVSEIKRQRKRGATS